jgi:hypothetical protein
MNAAAVLSQDLRAGPRYSTPACRKQFKCKRPRIVIVKSTDYVANATDSGVLLLPLKQELEEHQLSNVFGYERDLQGRFGAFHCVSFDDSTAKLFSGIHIKHTDWKFEANYLLSMCI